MITTARELRIRTKAILDAVSRGEEVLVTHRGRTCAKIVPATLKKAAGSAARRSSSPLFGIWKDNLSTKNVSNYIDELRRSREP